MSGCSISGASGADLELLRGHDQTSSTASQSVIDAAQRVFNAVDLVGCDMDTLHRLFGRPGEARRHGEAVLFTYSYRNERAGVARRVWLEWSGRRIVTRVEPVLTQ